MSASLVGSEMCIRDRYFEDMKRRIQQESAAERRARRTRIIVLQHEADAVSYTHLTLPTICSV
eukprot:6096516-Alexandrium_andersonii.AAC.1